MLLSSTVCFTRAVVGNIYGNFLNKLLQVESEVKVPFINIPLKHTYVLWQHRRDKPLFRHPDLCHAIYDVMYTVQSFQGVSWWEEGECVGLTTVISYTKHSFDQITLAHILVNSVTT